MSQILHPCKIWWYLTNSKIPPAYRELSQRVQTFLKIYGREDRLNIGAYFNIDINEQQRQISSIYVYIQK